MLEGIKEKLTQPIGPLPAFAWVIVAVGGYFGYKFLSNRSGSSSSTAQTVGASSTPVSPSSSDYAALTSQISTLGNQISDLQGTVAGVPGSFNNPIQGGVVNPGPVTGMSNAIVQPIAAVTTTAQTVSSTATHALSTPAPMPVFSNNTATPTPVATITAPVIQAIRTVTQPGATAQDVIMGTQGKTPATAISIPATTPTPTVAPTTVVAPVVKPVVQTIRKVTQPSPTKVYSTPSKTATVRVS